MAEEKQPGFEKLAEFDTVDTDSILKKYIEMYGELYDAITEYENKFDLAKVESFRALQHLEEVKAHKDLIAQQAIDIERENTITKISDLESSITEERAKANAEWIAATDLSSAKQLQHWENEKKHDEALQKAREKNLNKVISIKEKFDAKIKAAEAEGDKEQVKALEAAQKKELEHIDKKIECEAQIIAKKEASQEVLDNKNSSMLAKINALKINKYKDEEEKTHYDASALTAALASFAKSLDNQIESIASYKSSIDTRLQGSVTNTHSTGTALAGAMTSILTGGLINFGSTSYWDNISKQITGAAGISPYVKQEDIASNVKSLVEQGINTNIAQRAFVQTIKDKIASTFDATNGTLLRLIRIQQQDSTAARLGMESMITQFLNNMYENTEYLNSVSKSVKSSLENAMSLMTAKKAISFEYQVQKWLGSYYSVGVSDSAVQSIAASLGKISSGDITGITEGGAGNLIVMAANQAGLSVANVLAKGLDDSSTNQLMQAMSGYLYDLLKNSEDNLVVQQQIANVYGMTAADLKAIANLYTDEEKTIANIAKSSSDYGESMARLNEMIGTMYKRESISEIMTNAFSNLQYTISAGIANNPVLYATYKVAGILQDVAGGIEIPMVSIMGNTVDLHTSVAELLQVATMSGSLLSGIGHMVAAGGDGGLTTSGLAKGFGIEETSGMTSVSRGGGIGGHMETTLKESTVSESGYIGNTNSNDVKNKTMTDATNDSNQQLVNAKDENTDKTTTDIYNNISNIITIFEAVIAGSKSLHVKVDDYGLTGWN